MFYYIAPLDAGLHASKNASTQDSLGIGLINHYHDERRRAHRTIGRRNR